LIVAISSSRRTNKLILHEGLINVSVAANS
jgi:hypothetical protein